jgi:hypothetical protein
VTTPGTIPVTTPEVAPTVAIEGLPLVHTPPVGVPVKVIVLPTQTWGTVPDVLIEGVGFTVIVVVA